MTKRIKNNKEKSLFKFSAQKWLSKRLKNSGVCLNGNLASDPKIYNRKFYSKVITQGSLGFGEAYMDKWWDCEKVDELICKLLIAETENKIKGKLTTHIKNWLIPRVMNMQSITRSFQVAHKHYDVGNDLYEKMLDSTMSYSCGYWKNASNLEEAQQSKLDLICKKLQLKEYDNVLEIGCGWGGFAQYASKNYNVSIDGITVSQEQKKFIEEKYCHLPIDVKLLDYRDITGRYDKIVSIGMFEHVGEKNYDIYFKTAAKSMTNDGVFVLHTIGGDLPQIGTDAWIHKYIFPNGQIPSLSQITKSCEEYFVIEDVHNFGLDYDKTLMAWFENFNNAWHELKDNYDERFYRMWSYYLKSCAGAFRSRRLQVYQIVLRKRLQPLKEYHIIR